MFQFVEKIQSVFQYINDHIEKRSYWVFVQIEMSKKFILSSKKATIKSVKWTILQTTLDLYQCIKRLTDV